GHVDEVQAHRLLENLDAGDHVGHVADVPHHVNIERAGSGLEGHHVAPVRRLEVVLVRVEEVEPRHHLGGDPPQLVPGDVNVGVVREGGGSAGESGSEREVGGLAADLREYLSNG